MRTRLIWLGLAALFAVGLAYTLVAARGTPDPVALPPRVSPSAGTHGDGLSDSHDGYRITAETLPTTRGPAVPVAFRILGPDGLPAAGYQQVQSKLLHAYLIRDDFSGYQHLHPELRGDVWTTAVSIPDGGAYRLYAEFTPRGRTDLGHPTVLGLPFVIPGDTALAALPAPAPEATSGAFTVTRTDGTAHLAAGRATLFRLRVSTSDGPAALEPYLDAYAHMSAFEVLTQAMTHLHPAVPADGGAPADGTLTFHAQFANRGEQRLFLQFQVAGQVHQVAFTVFVT